MKSQAKKNQYIRSALALSLCAFIIWIFLGIGASLAWFNDTSKEVTNTFHFADFKLELSHRLDNGDWETVDSTTEIFNDEACYEPGYIQVVYLRVTNKGTIPFEFKTSVTSINSVISTNVYDEELKLQEHLKFGLAIADTYEETNEAVKTRALAKAKATSDLGDYETDTATLAAGETSYMALVVYMPEDVGNEANYRGEYIPQVNLGIIAAADQIKNQ